MRQRLICTFAAVCLFTGGVSVPAGAQTTQKSAGRAFLYSLLVPGLGQNYVEHRRSIKYFAAAELLMIGLAAGHEYYSDWLEEDYHTFAVVHAGVDPAGKNKDYYIEISKYNSIYIYNEKMRVNRAFDQVIPEIPENIWVWDSSESRLQFHFKRVDADEIGNRALYFYYGMVLNHLVSGIHAAILAKRYNKPAAGSAVRITVGPVTRPGDAGLTCRITIPF